MHIVIASFAVVILAIAILFSQRYEFIGDGKNIYRLDNFTGKIEKIEGSTVVKLNRKISIKKVQNIKIWKNYEDRAISANLSSKFINDTLYLKLTVHPKVKNLKINSINILFFDKDGFLLRKSTLTEKILDKKGVTFYSSIKIPVSIYLELFSWQVEY